MKLTVERDQFADAVTTAAKALAARPSVPILGGVMLRTGDDGVTVSGFDYEVSNESWARGTVTDPGAALVSGRLLAEITKALPHKPVDLAAVGTHLELVCGSARFTLPTMPVEDYPQLPAIPDTIGHIDAAVFAQAIARATVAAGRDDTLPMMTGVRMEFRGGMLSLLATDRYRLAAVDVPFSPVDPDLNVDVLAPASMLRDTAKTWTGATIEVSATAGGDGLVGFTDGRRKTTSRLLDGANYPPVRALFPDSAPAHAVVPVGALTEVVKRVALVAERTTPVLLTFTPDDTVVVVEAGGSEEARASEALDIGAYSGEPMTIGFNPQYLLDGLGNLGAAHAHIAFVDAYKPAVISAATDTGEPTADHRYLIMPIRVSR